MRLFTRTYLQGMHDGLVDSGVMRPFPSDDAAVAVFDKLAEDAGLPPILEAQLSKEAALPIAKRMKATSDKLASDGSGPTAKRIAMAKQASLYDLGARASVAASFYMEKAANEGSLTPNDENTLANAAKDDQLAKIDNSNRPEGTYRTPRGETDLPVPGVVGREVPAPHAPTTGTTVKAADGAMASARPTAHPPLEMHGETWASRKNQIKDLAARFAAGARGVGGAIGQFASDHVAVDPRKQLGLAQMQHSLMGGLEEGSDALARMRSARNQNIGGLAVQGLGAAGALTGLGLGAKALYDYHHQPGAEDMEVTAAENVGPVNRALTFLVGLHNKTAGTWVPSEEAKVAAAGLGAAGAPGLEAMSTILSRVKTADDAESELHQILQVLDAQGIPPSPELVQALAQALGEGGDEGAGAPPPAGPPSGEPQPDMSGGKEASLVSARAALAKADSVLHATRGSAAQQAVEQTGMAASRARKALDTAKAVDAATSPLGRHGGKLLAGAGAAVAAVGAKKLHDHLRGDGGEKEAADAFWADILKAAGEGSLTPNDENTLANAAKDDQLAKVDQKNRAEGKYKKPQGQTDLSTEAGEVGAEKEAEDAYLANLRKTAADWGSKLPAAMPIEKKREEIAKIASLAPGQRAAYVESLKG